MKLVTSKGGHALRPDSCKVTECAHELRFYSCEKVEYDQCMRTHPATVQFLRSLTPPFPSTCRRQEYSFQIRIWADILTRTTSDNYCEAHSSQPEKHQAESKAPQTVIEENGYTTVHSANAASTKQFSFHYR